MTLLTNNSRGNPSKGGFAKNLTKAIGRNLLTSVVAATVLISGSAPAWAGQGFYFWFDVPETNLSKQNSRYKFEIRDVNYKNWYKYDVEHGKIIQNKAPYYTENCADFFNCKVGGGNRSFNKDGIIFNVYENNEKVAEVCLSESEPISSTCAATGTPVSLMGGWMVGCIASDGFTCTANIGVLEKNKSNSTEQYPIKITISAK